MYTLIRLYVLTADIFDKFATVAFNLRTWDSDTRIGIISSVTESIRIVCNLLFENQLFGYIHYCTEIPEINIKLLPNTCNFYRKFRFIFRYISLRMRKMCILEKINFKISRGSMPPDPSALASLVLDAIFAGLTLNCFRRACYYHRVILNMISRILRTQKDVSFLSRKGCTFRIIQRNIF